MSGFGVHLKDFSGRDFGGDFDLLQIENEDGQVSILLQYAGRKASKRLTVASLQLGEGALARIKAAIDG